MSNGQETNFEHINYSLPKFGVFKWISYILIIFVVTVILYFPFLMTVESLVKSSLTKIQGCPIQISELNFELFSPKIIIPKTTVPKRCLGQSGSPIILEQTKLLFRGFTFSPFGPHFKLETNLLSNNIEALITTGISETKVNINDNKISLQSLQEVFDQVKLNGDIKINAVVNLKSNKLNDLKLTMNSSNFGLSSQKVQNFNIYALKIRNLNLIAEMDKGKIQLKNFILGDKDSPIRANFKGFITPNNNDFSRSISNLKGEVAFSKEFEEQYSFLNLLMGGYTKKDRFYQLEIKGPLGYPSIKSPRK